MSTISIKELERLQDSIRALRPLVAHQGTLDQIKHWANASAILETTFSKILEELPPVKIEVEE